MGRQRETENWPGSKTDGHAEGDGQRVKVAFPADTQMVTHNRENHQPVGTCEQAPLFSLTWGA